MASRKNRLIQAMLIMLVLLICFDIYYFFIRRQVGPSYYFNLFFGRKFDPIFQKPIYRDYVKIYESLNRRETRENLIVFLGDSIIARFNVYEYFSHKPVLNRGIYSDTTAGLRERLAANCNNLDISKCFLLIGHNDIKYRENDEILKNLEDILTTIRADEIYILSLLPVHGKTSEFKQRINQMNIMLERRAAKPDDRIFFLDLFPHFVNRQGEMKRTLSEDGVHPGSAGYRVLAALIAPKLASGS